MNPHLIPMSGDQRRSYNDQHFAYVPARPVSNLTSWVRCTDHLRALSATLAEKGLGAEGVSFLRSLYDTQPELAYRLRSPRTSREASKEFRYAIFLLCDPRLRRS